MIQSGKKQPNHGIEFAILVQSLACSVVVLLLVSCENSRLIPLTSLETYMPPTVTVIIKNYCPAPDHAFTDVFVSNYSAEVWGGKFLDDFDRDGIPNIYDSSATLGLSPYSDDSNQDGYHDLLVYRGGFALAEQRKFPAPPRCPDLTADDDHDGLSNCEEQFITHTDPQNPDTDGDGIPDGLEVRAGLDPLDGTDAHLNPDGDNWDNYQEVKFHTPFNEYNNEYLNKLAYQYQTTTDFSTGSICYTFTVSNIGIANVSNSNLISVQILEQKTVSVDPSNYRQVPYLTRKFILVPRTQKDKSVLSFDYGQMQSEDL